MSKQALNDDTIRVRLPRGMKKRAQRVAAKRGCDMSDVAREGFINWLDAEENRLGIRAAGNSK